MEFSTLKSIEVTMRHHNAPYWRVYDSTNKRLLYENENATSIDESIEALKIAVANERGDFLQVRVKRDSFKNLKQGGDTTYFGPYYVQLQDGPKIGQPANNGFDFSALLALQQKVNEKEIEIMRMKLEQDKPATIWTPENIGAIIKQITPYITPKAASAPAPAAIQAPSDSQALNEFLKFPQAQEAIQGIVQSGPENWQHILAALKQYNIVQ
jgi:hypothetical protein